MSGTEKFRLFFLGAGFSKPAGLPLASELQALVERVAESHLSVNGFNHLTAARENYNAFVEDTDPGRPFDLEQFGAWLDWEHVLRMKGSDTFSEHGNQAGLQLKWAIGKVLHELTPQKIPQTYLDFARRLTTTDRVLTLNYDILLELALDKVGPPYIRYPGDFSEIYDGYSVWDSDQPQSLRLYKLHGSVDWTYLPVTERTVNLGLQPLVRGPRQPDDPLSRIAVIPRGALDIYYTQREHWWTSPPLLMPPSTAKPLAGSPLIPLWDGVGLMSYMLGGVTIIGCSLPAGDPYVVQLVHHVTTDYAAGRSQGGSLWPQRRMKLVDFRPTSEAADELLARYRFMDRAQTDCIMEGFSSATLPAIFDDSPPL